MTRDGDGEREGSGTRAGAAGAGPRPGSATAAATDRPPVPGLAFRPARPADADRLQAIRRAAFAPVFASFRSILGDELYELAQRRDDDAQEGLLASLMAADSGWEMYVAELGGNVVGFVAVRLDRDAQLGEIGLNAVDPDWAGNGIGTAMYAFALSRMKQAGMQVATVGVGGDPSHEPARRAYRNVGFDAGIPSVWLCRTL